MRKTLPLSFLRERFAYDPITGAVVWKERPLRTFATDAAGRTWNTRYAGKGGTLRDGYVVFRVEFEGQTRRISAHTVAFALHNGAVKFSEIDHVDGDRANNRPGNLRAANRSQNNANRPGWSKSGLPKGVTSRNERFFANATTGGRTRHLGTYDTPEDAHRAFAAFAARTHGHFCNTARA